MGAKIVVVRSARPISRHEQLRREAGYSITALAKALGFSHTYVSRVEGGHISASPRYRMAFCRLLRVPEQHAFPEGAGV